jgi:hypothetical protein
MNRFDGAILEFFNRFSQKSGMFDQAIYLLSDTDLLKGGVVVAILWALWFTRADEETVAKTRKTVIATFAGTFLALAIGIVLENALPFRFRPIHQPGLHFPPPSGSRRIFSRGGVRSPATMRRSSADWLQASSWLPAALDSFRSSTSCPLS